MQADILTALDVTKRYANHTALKSVSLAVPQQSIYGLLGPNGAGKTTLIRIVNQILAMDEGTITWKNERLSPDHIYRIGYLPEERGLYKKMKVGEQALYLSQLKGLNRTEADRRLRWWFKRFDIMSWWNRKVEELSKGMQQKVQFVVTVIHEPELLIFDEPFSGFDPINVNILKEEILRLRNEGATIIFSTHNMASVEELCDHIALLNRSEKILEGKVVDIKNTYKTNAYIVYFEGSAGSLRPILHPAFEILEEDLQSELKSARIRLPKEANPNDLIASLLPHVTLHGLSELLPTMNEIFISKVNEYSKPSP
ncbi:MAG: ATP-binding cassette domain-containing protein [Bacteroidales bacterium]|nr:ATP-binding cassette domain-containing protein [Lentimicrobiaceae bacterium]MDD5694638.1 ATP-binding cassette domain-containing protein [Bacteroidales bacterium]